MERAGGGRTRRGRAGGGRTGGGRLGGHFLSQNIQCLYGRSRTLFKTSL